MILATRCFIIVKIGLWNENTLLFTGALLFFLFLRPITFGLSSAITSILVVTNLNPLVHSRLHRWVLGQNIGFFDDDFAGRIAQKEMQAARAVSDAPTTPAAGPDKQVLTG